MTLRLRLVIALVVLATAGLAAFGIVTYSLYARSQYRRLDDQARSLANPVADQLLDAAGLGRAGPDFGLPPGHGSRPGRDSAVVLPAATYAELRDNAGAVIARVQLAAGSERPDLPAVLSAGVSGTRFLDAGSIDGSTRWRVYVQRSGGPETYAVVVAVPTTEVAAALRRLTFIEGGAALALLTALAGGSWLILRRGLRPLEHMATSARSITAGDLSRRVVADDPRTEVGQLGLALNTMLGEMEVAFRERDATERRLRRFLADASHELRTPLTSIRGFAELFRVGDRSRVDLAVIVRRIEEESNRMSTLVDDLLTLARLDETRPSSRAPVDLAVLAADACSDAVAVAPDRPVSLDAPEPVVAMADPDHLRQAIANLVGNALRHTPPGTAIEVSARNDRGGARVSVRDHGPGLSEEATAHVFDRFWQADEARVGSGAGLGLAIVAGIAAEHGGRATVADAEGGGTRFTLELRVLDQPDGHAPSRPS